MSFSLLRCFYPQYFYAYLDIIVSFTFFNQTNFRTKELEVYKCLEGHKNIVTHYGVTFRGSDRTKVNIFMEKCGMFYLGSHF